jgi:uncharacterized protein YecE (DUF72 family)
MRVWIGTSGYSYPEWLGNFYPSGTQSNKMLKFYSQCFPLVELNFTFYRPPTPSMLARLADQTPEGFQFIVKLPQTISHEEKPDDLPLFKKAVKEMETRGKLLGVLCQLPQSNHCTRSNLDFLDRLREELAGHHLAVEFRHRSEVPEWLRERDVDLVSVDVPDIRALYPRGVVQSTRRIYVRFHSRNAGNWYLGDKERYDFDYSDADLTAWINSLTARTGQADHAFLLLNNCRGGQAVRNAQRFQQLLPRTAPQLDVVEPPEVVNPAPRQRTLFD